MKVKGWTGRDTKQKLAHLNGWKWSSYRGYAGIGEPEERIDYQWLNLMGKMTVSGRRKAYRRYAEQMAGAHDEEFLKEYAESRYALGGEEYREEVTERLKAKRLEQAVTGDVVWPEDRRPGIELIEAAVIKEFGVPREHLHVHGHRAGVVKSVAVELSCRLSGRSQREVGRYYGYGSDAGVCLQRKRLQRALSADRKLSARIDELAEKLAKLKVKV